MVRKLKSYKIVCLKQVVMCFYRQPLVSTNFRITRYAHLLLFINLRPKGIHAGHNQYFQIFFCLALFIYESYMGAILHDRIEVTKLLLTLQNLLPFLQLLYLTQQPTVFVLCDSTSHVITKLINYWSAECRKSVAQCK